MRLPRLSLLWRIFLVDASLVTAAVVVLAFTPFTVSSPATRTQLAILGGGLVVVLAGNLMLLRTSLRPLYELSHAMGRIDLLKPGERLRAAGGRELTTVIAAFNDMLARLERERRVSSSRALGRQEDERRLIARELHDQVGQGLTALLLQLKHAAADSSGPALSAIGEAQEIARENLDEVRRIARRLRPTVLDDLGLVYALAALADAAEDQSDVAVIRNLDHDAPRVSPTAELALYRIAQEALTNVARHASASIVELALRPGDDGQALLLEVNDNGRGMLYAADVEAGGIRGMRERALAIGADLSVTTRPGGGTSVAVSVPEDA